MALDCMLDDFIKNAVVDEKLTKGFAQMRREMEVADLKEEYGVDCLKWGVTQEEYAMIPAGTQRADDLKRAQDTAYLMTQVVGQEEPDYRS